MTSSPPKKLQLSGRNVLALSAVGTLMSWVFLCFCSFLPFVLFLSFLFNAVFLGSGLFSVMAQEREKRTIDALRLTQLSSLDILRYKARGELKMWKVVNGLLLVTSGLAALWAQSPIAWALVGATTLAAGGLLSIALALAVSTRCETTSSAVVSGWVTKGVWLVGLPILDFVIEAVFVLHRDLNLFSYLDPAWVYGTVVSSFIFETGSWSLLTLALGGLVTALVAIGLVVQSSWLIDGSFEAAATLDDRHRHSVYSARFPFGLEKNPFMVREMAWQVRTGAGAWPGYAVFFTLFLAPFLYGLAQQSKHHEKQPVKVVRQSVARPTNSLTMINLTQPTPHQHVHTHPSSSPETGTETARYHEGFCLSQMMGLPVPTEARRHTTRSAYDQDRIVVQGDGNVSLVADHVVASMNKDVKRKKRKRSKVRRSFLQNELDRGLLTGLILSILYLFIRGGAFMSGAVTGEKERRAWDQIALTGATPHTYLSGKLLGVLYFPMRQLLLTSPILILFALYGGRSLSEILAVVGLLVTSFMAAAGLGLLSTSCQATSHQAQGMALTAAATLLVVPMVEMGWVLGGVMTFLLLRKVRIDHAERLFISGAAMMGLGLLGGDASPLTGVMRMCNYQGVGPLSVASTATAPVVSLLLGMLTMLIVAVGTYKLSLRSLSEGGSVRA